MLYKNTGKINYSIIRTPNILFEWCYSSDDLKELLNKKCKGQIINKVYVDLPGFLEVKNHGTSTFDFSYLGNYVLFVFNSFALEFRIHAKGLIEYRITDIWEIKTENVFDFPPDDMFDKSIYYYEIQKYFDYAIEGMQILGVEVTSTNSFPFLINGLDEERAKKAEQKNCLPDKIHFVICTGASWVFYGGDLDGFFIECQIENDIVKKIRNQYYAIKPDELNKKIRKLEEMCYNPDFDKNEASSLMKNTNLNIEFLYTDLGVKTDLLSLAASELNVEMIELLLQNGADPNNTYNNDTENVLWDLQYSRNNEEDDKKLLKILKLLLDHGGDPRHTLKGEFEDLYSHALSYWQIDDEPFQHNHRRNFICLLEKYMDYQEY